MAKKIVKKRKLRVWRLLFILIILGGQFFDLFENFIFFSHLCTALFIYFVGCAGSLLLCRPSLVAESKGLLSSCCAWAFYSGGLSRCGAQALQALGLQ